MAMVSTWPSLLIKIVNTSVILEVEHEKRALRLLLSWIIGSGPTSHVGLSILFRGQPIKCSQLQTGSVVLYQGDLAVQGCKNPPKYENPLQESAVESSAKDQTSTSTFSIERDVENSNERSGELSSRK